jgi:hypothetical protein
MLISNSKHYIKELDIKSINYSYNILGEVGLVTMMHPTLFLMKSGAKAVSGEDPPVTSHSYTLIFFPFNLSIFKTKSL